jgi:hypothetical protein
VIHLASVQSLTVDVCGHPPPLLKLARLFGVLQDDLKLRRWDRHGYHDLRLAAESSQRKLHKCRRQAIAAARQPVAPLFTRLATALGIQLVKGVVSGLSVDAIVGAAAPRGPEDSRGADPAENGELSGREDDAAGLKEVEGHADAWHMDVMQTLQRICDRTAPGTSRERLPLGSRVFGSVPGMLLCQNTIS